MLGLIYTEFHCEKLANLTIQLFELKCKLAKRSTETQQEAYLSQVKMQKEMLNKLKLNKD